MKVTHFLVGGGFMRSKVGRLRVYRNEQFLDGIADPAGWRLVADLSCADESKDGTPIWSAPDFEVEPGGLYTFMLADGDGRPLIILNPEGLAVPEGVGQMKYSEWQAWASGGGSPAEGGE